MFLRFPYAHTPFQKNYTGAFHVFSGTVDFFFVSSERRLEIFDAVMGFSPETASGGSADVLLRRAANLADNEGRRGTPSEGMPPEPEASASFSLTTTCAFCKEGRRKRSLADDIRRTGVADETGGPVSSTGAGAIRK